MRLPPGLREEAAAIIYEFWCRHDGEKRGATFVPWEKVPRHYQMLWVGIMQLALEMTVAIVLSDATRFLENSNGDMGAAFAKALKRYASDILDHEISQ